MRTVYMAYCFLREALHRFTGTEREASPATTLFMTAIVAGAVAEVTAPIFRVLRPRRPKPPSLVDCLTGVSVVRFAARSVAGEHLQIPFADAIIVSALLAPALTLITFPVRIARAFMASLARAWRSLALQQ